MILRVSIALIFFILAGLFVNSHGSEFYLSFAPINFILEQFYSANELFTMPVNLQLLLMKAIPVSTWFVWIVALLASVFVLKR